MRENAFVEAWKTQHRRVSMILGLTLLCAPSAISVYAENGVNDITVQAVMQTKTVKGTVLDENGEPLIGVSIVVKGTSTGTITDFDGKFSINLPAGSIQHLQQPTITWGQDCTLSLGSMCGHSRLWGNQVLGACL